MLKYRGEACGRVYVQAKGQTLHTHASLVSANSNLCFRKTYSCYMLWILGHLKSLWALSICWFLSKLFLESFFSFKSKYCMWAQYLEGWLIIRKTSSFQVSGDFRSFVSPLDFFYFSYKKINRNIWNLNLKLVVLLLLDIRMKVTGEGIIDLFGWTEVLKVFDFQCYHWLMFKSLWLIYIMFIYVASRYQQCLAQCLTWSRHSGIRFEVNAWMRVDK